MSFKDTLLLTFLLISQTSSLKELSGPLHNERREFSNVEWELVEDLASGNGQDINFIFFGSALEIGCFNFTCEKYSLTNLEVHVSARSERIYYKNYLDDDFRPYLHRFKIIKAGSSDRNVIILKLKSFALDEIKHLQQIRKYNMKSFLVVFAANDETFIKLKNHILTSGLFNIYLIKKSSNPQVYLLYEVCAFCSEGKHLLRYHKGWQQGTGFITPFKFTSSFKNSFFGAKISVGTLIYPPVIFPIGI